MATPLVFVPGIMGSSIKYLPGSGQDPIHIWRAAYEIRATLLRNFGLLRYSPTSPGDWIAEEVLEAVPLSSTFPSLYQKEVYRPVMETLRGIASRQQTHLYPFPYDWRQAVDISADKLEQFFQDNSISEARILAHSMGCLVVRRFLQKNPTRAGQVEVLIEFAPPFLGSPKSFYCVHHSEFMLNELLRWVVRFWGIYPATTVSKHFALRNLRDALLTMPGVFDLFPHMGRRFVRQYRPLPRRFTAFSWPGWGQLDVNRAKQFQVDLEAGPQVQDMVARAFRVISTSQDTDYEYSCRFTATGGYAVIERSSLGWLPVYRVGQGDGTVPSYSARAYRGRNHRMKYVDSDHDQIPNDQVVLEWLGRVLR